MGNLLVVTPANIWKTGEIIYEFYLQPDAHLKNKRTPSLHIFPYYTRLAQSVACTVSV